jgi:hypothetical protein
MALFYWTTNPESKAVYHDKQMCSEGEKILAQDRVDSDVRPANRTLCEKCPEASD